jgi:hypothetical protein
VKQRSIVLRYEAKRSNHLNELDVRKLLVACISERNEELRIHSLFSNLTISNPGFKVVSSSASPGWMVSFLRLMMGVF